MIILPIVWILVTFSFRKTRANIIVGKENAPLNTAIILVFEVALYPKLIEQYANVSHKPIKIKNFQTLALLTDNFIF